MITDMRIFFTFLMVCFCLLQNNAQSNSYVEYTYDAAGNRISRQVITLQTNENDLKSAKIEPGDDINSEEEKGKEDDNEKKQIKESDYSQEIISDYQVRVYPNPTEGILKIAVKGDVQNMNIMVFNLAGKQIVSSSNTRKVGTVNLSSFPGGSYILRVQCDDEWREWKIIKK